MDDGTTPPVAAGLAAGIGLIAVFIIILWNNQTLPPGALSAPYTQSQKTAIRIALANDTVQELFQGKEMETGVVRPTGGIDNIWLVIIQEKGYPEKHLLVGVDQLTGSVLRITPSTGWLSAYPDSFSPV